MSTETRSGQPALSSQIKKLSLTVDNEIDGQSNPLGPLRPERNFDQDILGRPRRATKAQTLEIFRGPVPDPETMRKYMELIPDAGERFFAKVEKEQTHRHAIEWSDAKNRERNSTTLRFQARADAARAFLSMLIGALIIAALVFLSIYFFNNGAPLSAITSLIGAIGLVVGGLFDRKNPDSSP